MLKPSRTAIISCKCGPSEIRSNGAASWSRMIGMSRAIAPIVRPIAHTAIIPLGTAVEVTSLYVPRSAIDFIQQGVLYARTLTINRGSSIYHHQYTEYLLALEMTVRLIDAIVDDHSPLLEVPEGDRQR